MVQFPRRHFLGWDRPLLPQAVAFLAGGWVGPAPLDLTRTLVIVPTRQSGRRLREALADFAAQRGSAVFPPRVVTPEALIVAAGQRAVASRMDALAAWMDVLRTVDLREFAEVFPEEPPARSFAWASRLAQQFVRLQGTLAENGLRIGDVAARVGAEFPETLRWEQLGELERRYLERLRRAGLRLAIAASDRPTVNPEAIAGIERVVLLGVVDPLPVAIRALENISTPIEADALVFAPEAEAAAFDAWGRPVTAAWTERVLTLPAFEERVHLSADPADEAVRIADIAARYRAPEPRGSESSGGSDGGIAREAGDRAVGPCAGVRENATRASPPHQAASPSPRSAPGLREGVSRPDEHALGPDARGLAVGIADADVLPLLEGEAARAGVTVFNPEGRKRRNGALYHLLAALSACARAATFDAIEALARCPDLLAFLAARHGAGFSAARFLQQLDLLRRRHLPADMAAARTHAPRELAAALATVDELLAVVREDEFPANVGAALRAIFAGRVLDLAADADVQLHDAAAAWTDVWRETAQAAKRFGSIAAVEWWDLALQAFGESRQPEEKPAGALELQGWLELLFEDAPHLVVAGLNDGVVPESVGEDAFLPESLRVRLGLKTNPARFARDAYLLHALAACRAQAGRLDLLLAKTSPAGDPLRPSRLLLRCSDAELPDRIAFLFRAPDSVGSHLPWTRAWRLQPRIEPPPEQVAVTSLRRWLVCPFRFYLKYVLRMEAVDAGKTELDAFDFGTLCHAALEAMGREPALRDCTDASVLREFLLHEVTRYARERHGEVLPLPLLIQVESARQRLGKFAELQARERAEGWVIQDVERPFAVEVAGLVVRGKIDRIDRHANTGAVRVVDYKTADTAVAPRAAHLRPIGREEMPREWTVVEVDGKRRVWSDLQLPLYRHALAPEWGSAIACGYVNVPKAVGETAFSLWDDYTPELHAAAMRCAEGVCTAIRRGAFWPPNEDIRAESDEFATLFHHGVADSVAWAATEPER